ncbi:LON peptidase substrate-binding domain-containing protein [soil metagenome]
MIAMPMFPLGSVLFPHMPLPLRVFENRYLVMLSRILEEDPAEFGVVLIERGQEVGGGEHRFTVGTVARIAQLEATDDFVVLVAEGRQRIAVSEWLADDPHPVAEVTVLPDLEWDDSLTDLRDEAERVVRRALARASEFDSQAWPPDVELSSDPASACWQLAGVAPVGTMDQVAMLQAATMRALLQAVIDNTQAAEETFDFNSGP